MERKRLYDTQSYDIACYFLCGEKFDNEENRDKLAFAVQTTIEDWLEFERNEDAKSERNNRLAAELAQEPATEAPWDERMG